MPYPYCYWGPSFYLEPFIIELIMKKLEKNWCWHVQLLLLERILTRWRRPVASSEALVDLLHWGMSVVLYCCTAMVIKIGSKVGVFFHCCFVSCCPGGRRGNMEWVVTQWRQSEASSVALDMPHWTMWVALHPHICMAIKWPVMEVHLFIIVNFVINHKHS